FSTCYCSLSHRDLRSFPTRRSSDLFRLRAELRLRLHVDLIRTAESVEVVHVQRAEVDLKGVEDVGEIDAVRFRALAIDNSVNLRSEEHTSELQSRENLVCRLLLEKK